MNFFMCSGVHFLVVSLISGTIFSLPLGTNNNIEGNTCASDDIELVNNNLGAIKGGHVLHFGDIALNQDENADPCTGIGCKWPKASGFVHVPVVISSSFTSSERSVIIQALESFHRTTCIRFYRRRLERDYVYVYPGTGCWSYLGHQGGLQPVSLQKEGCVYLRTAQHELLHVLGFHHEHVRSDRDDHVTILEHNIRHGHQHNFKKVETNHLNTPYDYNSVMHYGRYAFSKDYGKLPTIVPKGDPNQVIGQATEMNLSDIYKVNMLYQCQDLN